MRVLMWPAMLRITGMGTPASAIRVIAVCRKSWIRSQGTPAASRTASHALRMPLFDIGRSRSHKFGDTRNGIK